MSEYKTTLEEFTLEGLKKIIDDAPEGWESYRLENDFEGGIYLRNYLDEFSSLGGPWETNWNRDFRQQRFTKDEIKRQINIKFLEACDTEVNKPLPKITPVYDVSTVSIDVSEFVNNVNISDGKVILNIDKCDIEGVMELFKGVEW